MEKNLNFIFKKSRISLSKKLQNLTFEKKTECYFRNKAELESQENQRISLPKKTKSHIQKTKTTTTAESHFKNKRESHFRNKSYQLPGKKNELNFQKIRQNLDFEIRQNLSFKVTAYLIFWYLVWVFDRSDFAKSLKTALKLP